MNLYLVIRWGNESSPNGANGIDTVFLVRAADHGSAALLVEPLLKVFTHARAQPFANVCIQLGEDQSTAPEPAILLGPTVQSFINQGYTDGWVRHYEDADWIHFADHGSA